MTPKGVVRTHVAILPLAPYAPTAIVSGLNPRIALFRMVVNTEWDVFRYISSDVRFDSCFDGQLLFLDRYSVGEKKHLRCVFRQAPFRDKSESHGCKRGVETALMTNTRIDLLLFNDDRCVLPPGMSGHRINDKIPVGLFIARRVKRGKVSAIFHQPKSQIGKCVGKWFRLECPGDGKDEVSAPRGVELEVT